MAQDSRIIKPEDYLEPGCPLCEDPYGAEPKARRVPQQRIMEKMDDYMSRRDYDGAERHLLYWLQEAQLGQDLRGELMIRNELVGHYRKVQRKDAAFLHAARALALLDILAFEGTLSSGTTYVNVATAYNAFGENEESMRLFEKARAVYESAPGIDPALLGGLYNNMALVCVSMKKFREADELYHKALSVMADVPGGDLEQAITCLNMANAVEDELGAEAGEARINELAERAFWLLDHSAAPRDGYYGFVCEKCAPAFSWCGYFMQAEELEGRAEAIYQRKA